MPRVTQHTATFQVEIRFDFPGLEPGECAVAYPEIEITYDFHPGSPAYTPRGEYAPIDPPDPAEVSFVKAMLVNGDGLAPSQDQVEEIARDFLDSDAGYREACQAVNYSEWSLA